MDRGADAARPAAPASASGVRFERARDKLFKFDWPGLHRGSAAPPCGSGAEAATFPCSGRTAGENPPTHPHRRRQPDQRQDPAGPPRQPRATRSSPPPTAKKALAAARHAGAGPDPARPHDAQARRHRGLQAAARRSRIPVHADHHGHRDGRLEGRGRRARGRRRRVPDQAGGPRGAGRAGALDAAHQGACTTGRGAGGRGEGVERHARAARRRRRSPSSSGSGACGASSRRSWPRRSSAAAPTIRCRATGAKSRWCSSTCAASPPSPRSRSPRR